MQEIETHKKFIPYSHQWVEEEDIRAVVEVLRSEWLTSGPKVEEFEQRIAGYVGAKYAVAVSSGTAALHAAMGALDIGPGDEVIVPPMTFLATANAIVFQGGVPVFADVASGTLLLDANKVESKITDRTRAIIAVDYAGQPCDYDALKQIAVDHGLSLVADACHSLGATYKGRNVGTLADMTVFSFHPVKHITTGEGGMVVTEDPVKAQWIRRFRNHGINADHAQRSKQGTWRYEMTTLGYNYRITDLQCALGVKQIEKLPAAIERRREIAAAYTRAFRHEKKIRPLRNSPDVFNSYHLYVIKAENRKGLFRFLRNQGIGVNVHYFPVYLHPFYRRRFGTAPGLCPVAEEAYRKILSLPVFPKMSRRDVQRVIRAVAEAIKVQEG